MWCLIALSTSEAFDSVDLTSLSLSLKLAANKSTGGILGSTPVLIICSSTSCLTFSPTPDKSSPSSR